MFSNKLFLSFEHFSFHIFGFELKKNEPFSEVLCCFFCDESRSGQVLCEDFDLGGRRHEPLRRLGDLTRVAVVDLRLQDLEPLRDRGVSLSYERSLETLEIGLYSKIFFSAIEKNIA
jgi:hypothetical protein